MLNWIKNHTQKNWPAASIENDGETVIAASAADIFERLDLASPRNALRERGFVFGPGNPAYNIFEATDPAQPEIVQIFEVTEYLPRKRYCFRSTFHSEASVGGLLEAASEYTIVPQKDGRHLLHLQETSVLKPGLTRNQYILERATLNFSVFRNLARLRLHIELGADAV